MCPQDSANWATLVHLVRLCILLIHRLWLVAQYANLLTTGAFEEAAMPANVEACDWLTQALRGLEPPFLDPVYANMRAVCSLTI